MLFVGSILTMLAIVALAGSADRAPSQHLRSLYDGDQVWFEQARFIKPREDTNLTRLYQLAPLIILDVSSRGDATPKETEATPAGPRQVYFQSGSADLDGSPHDQITYWWKASATNSPADATGYLGVRITMNRKGVPSIYEVLGGAGSLRQIFVTQSVEAAARDTFGPALPGRRHAVEPGLSNAPTVVVPRVLDDPPDLMGPILYLRADGRAVDTLICRCMNAQAGQLTGQGLYELVPATASRNTSDATRLEAEIPRWLREDFSNQTNRLSRSLRLPGSF